MFMIFISGLLDLRSLEHCYDKKSSVHEAGFLWYNLVAADILGTCCTHLKQFEYILDKNCTCMLDFLDLT